MGTRHTVLQILYNCSVPWSRLGVFNRIFTGLVGRAGEPECLMIDATHLNAHRTAASRLEREPFPTVLGTPKVT